MKKQRFIKIAAIVLVAVLAAAMPCQIQAASYTTWDSLPEVDIRNTQIYDLHDIINFFEKQTINTGIIYDSARFYNDILLSLDSRITYCKKLRVDSGDNISVVAATNDTVDQGGTSISAGQQFYWCFTEYDETGNLVFDGGWRSVDRSWRVGMTTNSDTGYGLDGYPVGVDQAQRHAEVSYVMPIFRWNNGDESVGAGERPIMAQSLMAFPIFYLVTKPFTYTFKLNGGEINGNKEDVHMERLGVTTISAPAEPTRVGKVFTGWKITSTGGKQTGKIYTQEELVTMLSDGKYYSSLFEDAVIEAQWRSKKPRLFAIGASSYGKVLYNMKLINANPALRKWYDEVGHLSTAEKCALPLDQVEARYIISKDGTITKLK